MPPNCIRLLIWGQQGCVPRVLLAVLALGVQNAPEGLRKRKTRCMYGSEKTACFFLSFRKQLSFSAALHLPAQKQVEEQTARLQSIT